MAISVPDPVCKAADRLARRLRVPRSQLYARAVEAYIKQQGRPDITERLNMVYAKRKNKPDRALLEYSRRTLAGVEWDD